MKKALRLALEPLRTGMPPSGWSRDFELFRVGMPPSIRRKEARERCVWGVVAGVVVRERCSLRQ
jgi:hypothetical protein